ncbi:citrulline utilization hydrolase CtlX [Maridesulfovibrio sp.]|uniref:citrulline utilization hydrolase CtlX n=1 Tax=Maridesulfovibrio sp. TaxID=2795000 RepID=UPI002A18DFDA|nr:arginine deiminase-related protein [Maridesulfovibrio sp.]
MKRISFKLSTYCLAFLLLFGFVCQAQAKGLETVEREQNTDTVLMVSPDDFGFNAQTAESNAFQNKDDNALKARNQALEESNNMAEKLRMAGVSVIVLPSRKDVKTPDAVFPNNWFSTHEMSNGERVLVLYPMLAPNRRAERRPELLEKNLKTAGYEITKVIDLTPWEEKNEFLEGTGSLVLDRVNGVAFAVLSPRTSGKVLDQFDEAMGYDSVRFHSVDKNGKDVYHTNVVMSVGKEFAVVCLESVKNEKERKALVEALEKRGKKIIPISLEQMYHMCGNIMELNSKSGGKVLLMSRTAFNNFTDGQKKELSKFCKLLPVDIETIERIGGGSARCMVGEVF